MTGNGKGTINELFEQAATIKPENLQVGSRRGKGIGSGKGTTSEILAQSQAITPKQVSITLPEPDVAFESDPLPTLEVGEGIQKPLNFIDRMKAVYDSPLAPPTYNLITGFVDDLFKAPVENTKTEVAFDIRNHEDLFQGVAETDYDYIADSTSLEDATRRKVELADEAQKMATAMQGGGMTAIAAVLIPNLADPITLGGIAFEGMAIPALATKVSRAARLVQVGKIAGLAGGSAAIETAINAKYKASIDGEDVLFNTIAGLGIGAVAGAAGDLFLNSGNMSKAADTVQNNMVVDLTDQMDSNLAESLVGKADSNGIFGMRKVKDIAPERAKLDVEGVQSESIMGRHDPDLAAERLAAAADATPGAEAGARIPVEEISDASYYEAFKLNMKEKMQSGTFNAGLITNSKLWKYLEKNPLQSDFVRLFKNKIPSLQYFTHEILSNASGDAHKTAAVLQSKWSRQYLSTIMPTLKDSYQRFAKIKGIRMKSAAYFSDGQAEFNSLLREELENVRNASVRGFKHISQAPDYIQEASQAWQKGMREMAEHAKANGVRGFDEFQFHEGYVPLKWNGKKMLTIMRDTTLHTRWLKLLSKGYESAGIEPADAKIFAKAIFNRKSTQALGLDSNPGALLSKDSREFFRTMLSDDGLSPSKIDALFARIDLTLANRGKSTHAKGRIPIDLTMSDGDLRLIDLVDNDLENLGTRYITEISGRSALARKGIKHDGAWRAIKSGLLRDASKTVSDAKLKEISEVLDATYMHFLGQPVGKGVLKGVRRLQELAQLTMLGMAGLPQLAESSTVFAAHGVANVFKYSSDLRMFRRAVKNGTADKTLLGDLAAHHGGMWGEEKFFRPRVRLDDASGSSNDMFKVLDNVIAGGKEVLGYMNGMNQIKNMQQQIVAISQANRVIKMLKSGVDNPRLLKRFKSIGWDDKMLASFKSKIDDGTVTFQKNGNIDMLNLEKWDDLTAENFTLGLHTHSGQLIQFPQIGETAYWMHGTLGSSLTQFRSYPIVAIEKQLGRNIRMADPESFLTASYGLAFSSMLYMSKVQVTSIGRKDRQAYLDERLNAGAIFNGALQWSGIFSGATELMNVSAATGLIPSNWSTGSVGRSGGSAYSLDSNVPAVSVAKNLMKFTTGTMTSISPLNENRFDKAEINAGFGAMVLGNTLPMIWLKNVIHGKLDEVK